MAQYYGFGQATNAIATTPIIPSDRESLMAVIDLSEGAARLIQAYPDTSTRPTNIQNALQELSNLSATFINNISNTTLKTRAQDTLNTLTAPGDGYQAILGLKSFNMMVIALLSGISGLAAGWGVCCLLRRYKK
jgi:hypothetical protein